VLHFTGGEIVLPGDFRNRRFPFENVQNNLRLVLDRPPFDFVLG
jgi:hypothetical protein